ncbi:hypothetical protein RD792_002340 [Penstemon davidsonii]|uniref:Protein kinase domain-containing protein n=1 Tax=Penstemon davidsonii TaxID=160366 RepID=A0ABR0DR31_9LAMI|nr:hypothetical protein RD792_002340 [Penstemon davidsonii]
MFRRAMGGRWTANGINFSFFAFLILLLQIHGCWSLNAEGLALLQFRAKVEIDPFGALENWNPNDCNPCMWSGVDCLDGKVHMLDLNGQDLEGALAPELGNLTHLKFLDLSKNHFSGTIPPQLGQLTSLEVLDLRDNNLTGNVPSELGELHSLKRLLLCNNRFKGSIPVEIRKLSLLNDLQFDEILTTSVSGISCVNRKIGHWLDINSLLHSVIRNVVPQVNNVRRILAVESSNLAAIPPNVGAPLPSEPVDTLPSRSSGSFPAIPNAKKKSPAPVPSPTPIQEHNPHDATSRGAVSQPPPDEKSGNSLKVIIGISSAVILLIVVSVMFLVFRSRAAKTIGPWKSGLSGQLQKAFVTGVPKLNRGELETACEDFSNIIRIYDNVATIYKGTLSSGVEIAVASTAICSLKDWSKRSELAFRKKIDSLSRINHKNFLNLIGYCEEDEPFTRMMVFEYAPNGTLFEHLHDEEVEHLDWSTRMRIIMGTAYCLQYMHDLNPPVAHFNLTSKEILLTDDYAAKIGDIRFWAELIAKSKHTGENESEHSELPPLADVDTNVHSFGILLLEIISGKHIYSEEEGHLTNWAAHYLNDNKTISYLIDPTLKSFKDNEVGIVCEVIQSCIQQDARKRPAMKEVIQKLRQVIDISPEAATPRLSPLWWAELEILSAEAA